jgi:uncharacterized membrane protein
VGAGALFIAVFLACAVEAVEATTIVLAAGTSRDWRSATTGLVAALAVLAVITAVLGPAVTALPLQALRLFVGVAAVDLRLAVARARRPCGPAVTRRFMTSRRFTGRR